MTADRPPPNRPTPPAPGSPDVVTVAYSRTLAMALLIIGVLCVIGGIVILAVSVGYVGLVGLGALLLVLGALYRKRTYFTFDPSSHTITTWAPLGRNYRPFWLTPGAHLSVSGSRFVANLSDGRRIKIPVYRFAADRDGWNAVLAHIPDLG